MARKMNDDERGKEDLVMRGDDRSVRRDDRTRRRFGRSSDEQAFYSGVLREEDGELDGPATPIDFDTLGDGRERFFHDEEADAGSAGSGRGGRYLLRQSRARRERREPRDRR